MAAEALQIVPLSDSPLFPRIQSISRVPAIPGVAFCRAPSGLFRKVLQERRERRDARHNDTQVVLNRRPHDELRRVEVVGQALDGLDAEYLDDGDEDAEGKEAEEHRLLAVLDLGRIQGREGGGSCFKILVSTAGLPKTTPLSGGHLHQDVQHDRHSGHCGIERNRLNTVALSDTRIPLFGDLPVVSPMWYVKSSSDTYRSAKIDLDHQERCMEQNTHDRDDEC
ncbi:hypothetical protein PG987_002795 [Apiospora arundinis]